MELAKAKRMYSTLERRLDQERSDFRWVGLWGPVVVGVACRALRSVAG
jgi:hypothetical protein